MCAHTHTHTGHTHTHTHTHTLMSHVYTHTHPHTHTHTHTHTGQGQQANTWTHPPVPHPRGRGIILDIFSPRVKKEWSIFFKGAFHTDKSNSIRCFITCKKKLSKLSISLLEKKHTYERDDLAFFPQKFNPPSHYLSRHCLHLPPPPPFPPSGGPPPFSSPPPPHPGDSLVTVHAGLAWLWGGGVKEKVHLNICGRGGDTHTHTHTHFYTQTVQGQASRISPPWGIRAELGTCGMYCLAFKSKEESTSFFETYIPFNPFLHQSYLKSQPPVK